MAFENVSILGGRPTVATGQPSTVDNVTGTVVPEPAATGLGALGLLLLVRCGVARLLPAARVLAPGGSELTSGAADYHVAATGDNSDLGTAEFLFATINYSAMVAAPGSAVWSAPGG